MDNLLINDDSKSLILIVDDVPKNLQVLGAVLYQAGYEVAMADNGVLALNMLEEMTPDLILLDVMMPEMDGYEVCGKIKENPNTNNIPIIFLTAKNETDSVVKGFDIGAVDYVTKPFNSSELLMRVKTHVELQRSKHQLLKYNEELKKLLENKNEFLGIAAHDMKNPINTIIGFTNLLQKEIQENFDNSPTNKRIIQYVNSMNDTAKFMFRTINEVLNTETLDTGRITLNIVDCNVDKIIDNLLKTYLNRATSKNINFYTKYQKNYKVTLDEDRFREIADNLISNAIKYSPLNKNIYISCENVFVNGKNHFIFSVKDEGPGLNGDDMNKVFGRFQKLSAKPTGGENSTGLGLSIVKKLVELHNGQVRVESKPNEGACFIVQIENKISEIFDKNDLPADFSLFSQSIKTSDIEDENPEIYYQINHFKIEDENSKEKVKKVLTILENDYLSTWESLRKTNIINDIHKFAINLREIGKSYNIDILKIYGEDLDNQAISFDIENLTKTLDCFEEIINKFNEQVQI